MTDRNAPNTSNPAWSFVLMARYNTLANTRLYNACADLNDAERRKDRGAFFGSIHQTLNHIMVGDLLWFGRLRDGETAALGLTDILYDEFETLRDARAALDAEMEVFAENLTPDAIAGDLAYRDSAGHAMTNPFATCMTQMFNHATHHRGQIHCMLTQAGHSDPPIFDVHYVLREAG